jgi:hypothetical protein
MVKKLHLAVKLFMLFLLIVLAGVGPFDAHADIAPPEQPPGSSIAPDEMTNVTMLAEVVEITIVPLAGRGSDFAERVQAKIKASFEMRNTGEDNEIMDVRFPLEPLSGWGDGWGRYPRIEDIQIRVDERLVDAEVIELAPESSSGESVGWAVFEVRFPAGKKVHVDVTYTLNPTGYFPIVEFYYLLETGAGWKGPIGSAEILMQLPYQPSAENIVFGEFRTTPGGEIRANSIRWFWQNIEPTSGNNIRLSLVLPDIWQRVLDARQAVIANPQNADAWAARGETCMQAGSEWKGYAREDPGGQSLVVEAVYAFEQAVALQPENANFHAGLAEVIWFSEMFFWFDANPDDEASQRVVVEINTALALDPANARALGLKEQIPAEYFLILTPTVVSPTFTPVLPTLTSTPRISSSATSTPAPQATASYTPITPAQVESVKPEISPIATPNPDSGSSFCFSPAALIILVLCGLLYKIFRS